MNVNKPQMVAPLQRILDEELARGNEVVESGNWPPKCRLLVLLRAPFHRDYSPVPEVEFVLINDPHYWQAEYRYRGGEQTLACGFG